MKAARARSAVLPILFFAGLLGPATAQTLDSSGDSMLNGTYYFRQVAYYFDQTTGAYDFTSLYGNITFNGGGGYSISGSACDYNDGCNPSAPTTFTHSGSYVIGANGFGYITSPYVSGDFVYGLVSHGVFVGSATETTQSYNDLLIAAPVGSSPATNSTFSGAYSIAYTDPTYPIDALFQLNPNGAGSIGTVNASGYYEPGTNSAGEVEWEPQSQTLTGVNYSFSNGAASVNFNVGNTSSLLPPNALLYISPDGNFVFGGAYNGWDIFVGVRTGSGTPNFNGLYYQAGIDSDLAEFDTYYGSLNAYSDGTILEHQRLPELISSLPGDYTFYDNYTLSGSTYEDQELSQEFIFSSNGVYRIGFGNSASSGAEPILGINVAIQAPSFTGPGVYLNPTGVLNGGSFAPFTTRLSPGELISLFGTGLSSGVASASTLPLPNNLGGVSVTVNGFPAPLLSVSPNQINAVVPFEVATASVALIQVTSNGQKSNTVTQLTNYDTSPGIFTYNPENGTGYASALHLDFSLVTESSPAQPGETIQVYVTGLGAVTPSVSDGSAGSSNPLSYTNNTIAADFSGTSASVGFAGLAPGFAGVYQLNITVPSSGLTAGDNALDIDGPDSYTSEALIPIGSGGAAAAEPSTADARSGAGRRVPATRRPHVRSIPRPTLRQRDTQ